MNIDNKDNLCNLTSQLQALNTIQNEYFSLTSFVADIKNTLESSFNSETNKYEQEGIESVLKIIDSQIDGYYRTSAELSTENYHLNSISKTLADNLQREIMSIK